METILLVAALLAVLATVLLIIWRYRLKRKRHEEIMRRIDAISWELAMDCLEDEE